MALALAASVIYGFDRNRLQLEKNRALAVASDHAQLLQRAANPSLASAHLDELVQQGYNYQLWQINASNHQRQIIMQSAQLPVDAIDLQISMPNTQWTLSIAPSRGWNDPTGLELKILIGLVLSLLLAIVVKQSAAAHLRAVDLERGLKAQISHSEELNIKLQATLDALPDLLFELDLDGRYLDYHSPRSELLAAPPSVFLGKTMHDILPPFIADMGMAALREANASGHSQGQQYELKLQGGSHWFEISVSRKPSTTGKDPTFIVLSRDITERKQAQIQLVRLSELYAAMSQCNQAILRCNNQAELFTIICHDTVDFGDMKMAWVGVLDEGSPWVRPVASHGVGVEFLDGIEITVDPSTPKGFGPTGTAIREDRPVWCQDFQGDRTTQAWRERGAVFGWGATAAIPLHCKGKVVAVFTVYSSHKNAFDHAVQKLFLEISMDISYALDRFADEDHHQQTIDDVRRKIVSRY